MATCRRFLNLAKKDRVFYFRCQKYYSTSAEVKVQSGKKDEIIIPYRIQRGPTDILKALASTVSKDYTAPQYKYEDDPYFIPASNITKRAFALSKESGRKAAHYFLEKYPRLFLCNQSVPHVKAFDPPTVCTEENVTSSEQLIECVNNVDVNTSIKVYEILKKKGIVVTQEVKQNLLELLCFYNGLQPPDEDYYEERYFTRPDPRLAEKWNAKGQAERLFDEMEKDSKAYSAIIAGAAKFQDPERAMELFDEMRSKDIIPTVEAYNNLIKAVPSMKEKRTEGCEYALYLLGNMKKDGLMPDLYTMNAVLEVFTRRRFNRVEQLTLSILAEMKNLNIEPSLGTYVLILSIFCEDKNSEVGVLYEIVNLIEGKEFTAQHPLDVTFFTSAMEKCFRLAHDKDLAYRINKIVEFGNNSKLLGHAILESVYFKYFLRTLCENEEFEKFMEVYAQYVPNTYTPEPALMDDILQALQFSGHYKYLPKLSNDIYAFEQTERENILSLIMETAGSTKHEKKVQKELVEVIWKIVDKLNVRLKSGRYNFSWTGELLGNALNTFVNGGDIQKSWLIIEQFADPESRIIGPPLKESLLKFCDLCLENREYEKVKFCIKYAIKEAYPEFVTDFKALAEDMFAKEKIEEKHRTYINDILQSISLTASEKFFENLKASSSTDSASGDSLESDSSSSDDDSSSSDEDSSSSSDEEVTK